MLPALGGAIVGVPAGLLLFAAVRNGGAMAYPPDWWLACVVIATPLVVGALTIVPSRLASRAGVAPSCKPRRPDRPKPQADGVIHICSCFLLSRQQKTGTNQPA
jgi:hypothetical protein